MKNTQKKAVLTLPDFFKICKNSYKKIIGGALFFAFLFGCYGMTLPLEYLVTSSFREKNKVSSDLGSSGASGGATLLISGLLDEGKNGSAISLLESKLLLEKLILQENMQAKIQNSQSQDSLFSLFWKNTLVFFSKLTKSPFPPLEDEKHSLFLSALDYQQEIPLSLTIQVNSDEMYQVLTKKGTLLGEGTFGKPFKADSFSFVLEKTPVHELKKGVFQMKIDPLWKVIEHLQIKLTVEMDKTDKNLLRFKYLDTDRKRAAQILNRFMDIYLGYLHKDNQRIAREQIHYLKERQDEMESALKSKMDTYAKGVQTQLSAFGFPDTSHAMEFLAKSQQQCRENLLKLTLNGQRLKTTLEKGAPFWEMFPFDLAEKTELEILNQIRLLKQQSDMLQLSVKKNYDDRTFSGNLISEQIKALTRLRAEKQESLEVIALLEEEKKVPKIQYLTHPSYLATYWQESLTKKERQLQEIKDPLEKALRQEEIHCCRAQFLSYITQLSRLLSVEEKAIAEGIFHAENPFLEYQGLSLEAALELFTTYNYNLNDLESKVAHYEFLIQQVSKPDVDLSSLPSFVEDPIASSICTSSLELILAFRDQENRSAKEQKHLDEALSLRKNFLKNHFDQSKELLRLRIDLLHQKLFALQDLSLGLIQQKISLLDKHLSDSCLIQMDKIGKEKQLIFDHQADLLKEMLDLPEKWVLEKLIDQELKIHQKMVEEVTRLVESKNIAKNLDVIQSSPIDLAVAPLKPKMPMGPLFMLLGAFLGGCGTLFFVLVKSVKEGVLASPENLLQSGFSVAGTLFSLAPSLTAISSYDLNVLRKALFCHLAAQEHLKERSFVLFTQIEKNTAELFASLLAKQGKRVCLLPLSFNDVKENKEGGLLGYLQGKCAKPKACKGGLFDFIEAGGSSRFSTELLESPLFKEFFKELSSEYDWVIGAATESVISGAALPLLALFQGVIIQVHEETLEELFAASLNFEEKQASFFFVK